jgi:hypothetical protein
MCAWLARETVHVHIHHKSVPGEPKHVSSKNCGPPGEPQNAQCELHSIIFYKPRPWVITRGNVFRMFIDPHNFKRKLIMVQLAALWSSKLQSRHAEMRSSSDNSDNTKRHFHNDKWVVMTLYRGHIHSVWCQQRSDTHLTPYTFPTITNLSP